MLDKTISLKFAGKVLALLFLWSCSTQKTDDGKAESDLLISPDSTVSTTVQEVLPVFETVDPKVKDQMSGFLADYFVVNQMLIADNQSGAKVAAKKLSASVKQFDMTKLTAEQMDFYLIQVSTLSQGLRSIDESTDIEKTRLALAPISESLYALAKAYHPNSSALYYQFCPMARNGKGANWLSGTKEIVNPYMGQMMPECGRTLETLR